MRSAPRNEVLARATLIAAAVFWVAGLLGAATARDDLGLRTFWADQLPADHAQGGADVPPLRPAISHAARPTLRIALMTQHRTAVARRRARPSSGAVAGAGRFPTLPIPTKPAIVSIYEDTTLRKGDAVMLADGIHVFRGARAAPFGNRDFIRLPLVASLGWKLRQTLNELDRIPPVRWSWLGSPLT